MSAARLDSGSVPSESAAACLSSALEYRETSRVLPALCRSRAGGSDGELRVGSAASLAVPKAAGRRCRSGAGPLWHLVLRSKPRLRHRRSSRPACYVQHNSCLYLRFGPSWNRCVYGVPPPLSPRH